VLHCVCALREHRGRVVSGGQACSAPGLGGEWRAGLQCLRAALRQQHLRMPAAVLPRGRATIASPCCWHGRMKACTPAHAYLSSQMRAYTPHIHTHAHTRTHTHARTPGSRSTSCTRHPWGRRGGSGSRATSSTTTTCAYATQGMRGECVRAYVHDDNMHVCYAGDAR